MNVISDKWSMAKIRNRECETTEKMEKKEIMKY